jgi:hypothetical protein
VAGFVVPLAAKVGFVVVGAILLEVVLPAFVVFVVFSFPLFRIWELYELRTDLWNIS